MELPAQIEGQCSAPENPWVAIQTHAAQKASHLAVVEPNGPQVDFSQFSTIVLSISAGVAAMSIGPEKRVVLALKNGAEPLAALFGVSGVCACAPLNPDSTESELAESLGRIRPCLLITDSETVTQSLAHRGVAERMGIQVIELRVLISMGSRPRDPGAISANAARPIVPSPNRVALVLSTSATSGRAKLVPHTESSLIAVLNNSRSGMGLTSEDRGLLLCPLFHILGINSAFSQLRAGGSLIVPREVNAASISVGLTQMGATWYTGVPVAHHAVLAHFRLHPEERPTALRFVRSSGGTLPEKLSLELRRVLGVPVIDTYGLTETGAMTRARLEVPQATGAPDELHLAEYVGSSLSSEIAIKDQAGSFLPPLEDGEIVVRGAAIVREYLDDPDATAAAFRHGWFHTGDYGHLDREGRLHMRGRIKDIVNRGGEKIIPEEVEAALLAHPEVAEAVVFAIPHPTLGEEAACAIVREAGSEVDQNELRVSVRGVLASYKIPRSILFMERIPRGSTGKPLRRVLAERFRNAFAAGLRPGTLAQNAYLSGEVQSPPSTTPTERRLLEIWCRLLGRDDLDVSADFFNAGGDSLAAITMLAEADQRFHGNASRFISSFFDNPTIANVARLLKETEDPNALSGLPTDRMAAFPVGHAATAPPIFCIPANGDEGLYFRRLAKHLTPNRQILILRPRNTWYAESPAMVEDAAREAVRLMLEEQTQGPFLIAAYCFGGIIAYEAARQLIELGFKANLIFLEVSMPGYPSPFQDWRLFLRRGIGEVPGIVSSQSRGASIARLRRLARRITWSFAVRMRSALIKGWDKKIVRRVYEQARRSYLPFYLPNPLDVPILHFLSEADQTAIRATSRMGWRQVALAGVTEAFVPNDHDAIFSEPNLPAIARAIDSWLDDRVATKGILAESAPGQSRSSAFGRPGA